MRTETVENLIRRMIPLRDAGQCSVNDALVLKIAVMIVAWKNGDVSSEDVLRELKRENI